MVRRSSDLVFGEPHPSTSCSISAALLTASPSPTIAWLRWPTTSHLPWRDSADRNQQKVTVSRDEFLRRFLPHLPPKGFVRIRHFGFLANRRRAALLPRCVTALPRHSPEKRIGTLHGYHPAGGPMVVVERFTAARNSNSVLHRSWPLLHEITRTHTATVGPARQRLPSDGFFERDASHSLSALSPHLQRVSQSLRNA